MKILSLSVVTQVVNQEGEELLERARDNKPKTVGEGLTKQWFEEQGLTPPPELLDENIERDEEGRIILDEKHLDYDETLCSLPLKNICSYVEHEEIGTVVYMKSGVFYHVYELVSEIDDYVEYLTTPWYKKQWISLKILFRRITNKKRVDLEELFSRPENQPNYKQ